MLIYEFLFLIFHDFDYKISLHLYAFKLSVFHGTVAKNENTT